MDREKRLEKEYELLAQLEQTTSALRHNTFTGILSISFLIPALGAAVSQSETVVNIGGKSISMFSLLFTFGFLFYCFAVYHYKWHHRYSHLYRRKLKEIEKEMGISVYSLRKRPSKEISILGHHRTFKLHFDWALYILGALYALIDIYLIGILFAYAVGIISFIYFILIFFSQFISEEPLEKT